MDVASFKKILEDVDIPFLENRTHIIIRNCPNCGGSDKLQVDKRHYLWQCFKCQGLNNEQTSKGNLYQFLKFVLEFDKFEIRQIMKSHEVIDYLPEVLTAPEPKKEIVVEKKEIKFDIYELPSRYVRLDGSVPQLKQHKEVYQYLFSRNVKSLKVIQKFRLCYDPAVKRLVFPAYNGDGLCVGVQTRDITDRHKQFHLKCHNHECSLFRKFYFFKKKEEISHCPECNGELIETFYPKSSNSRDFPKTEFFFNQQNVDWTKPVVMVEGPFDCINTTNSIGLLGRTLSDTQLFIMINNLKSDLILYLDGDDAGNESTKDVYHKLSLFIDRIKICFLEDGEDPGSFTIEENEKRIEKAVSPQEWFQQKGILF